MEAFLNQQQQQQQQQPQQQQPPNHPVIVELLLPHRYCTWNAHPNILHGMPIKNRPLWVNPFPLPLPDVGGLGNIGRPGEAPVYPPPLKFNELSRMRLSTKEGSHTKITEGMKKAPQRARLHQIRVSDRLWTALVGFAVGPGAIPPVGLNAAIPQPYLASFRQQHFNPVAPMWYGTQQSRGVRALWWWFLMHNNTLKPLVNSEPSVQDEIQRQLLYPIDQLILTRYRPIFYHPHFEREPFIPRWVRPVEEARVRVIGGSSGIPDFVLYTEDIPGNQSAVAEVKTSWSYDLECVAGALSNQNCPNGIVNWESDSIENRIIKQLWAEMYTYNVKFGFWTNGEHVFAALDTSHIDRRSGHMINELTMSRLQDITSDNYIYQGLTGLAFASIECSRLEGAERSAFVDALCPPQWRNLPGPINEGPFN